MWLMMFIFQLIPGFMVGIEFLWDDGGVVLDLGILRVMIASGDNNNFTGGT